MFSWSSSHPCSWVCFCTLSNCCSIVWSLTCLEVETRTYAATLMVALLTIRAQSMSLLVFEAPAQDAQVRSVPALAGIRAFHHLPTYAPLAFHSLPRAE